MPGGIVTRPVGLALSGGGLRGAAHLGVLRVLEHHHFVPDLMAGTSAGALVTALYLAGFSLDKILQILENLNKKDVYDWNLNPSSLLRMILTVFFDAFRFKKKPFSHAPTGLIKGKKLEFFLQKLLGNRTLDDCRLPCIITATDLNSGELVAFMPCRLTPRNLFSDVVIIRGAPLWAAVRASTAIPGVFEPFVFQDRTLVDGGVKNNLPVDLLQWIGARKIMAVDLGYAGNRRNDIDNIVEIITQSLDIIGGEATKFRLHLACDLVIRPGINDVGLTDFHRLRECAKRGQEATEQMLPQIAELFQG